VLGKIFLNIGWVILLPITSLISACQSVTSTTPQPISARLVKADDASLYNLRTAIETVMQRKNIIFGVTNWDSSSIISVLPVKSVNPNGAPFNQQDFARPTLFNLMMQGEDCYLVQQGTEEHIPLTGVACEPLPPI